MRLRFWLFMLDICDALRLPNSVGLWFVRRASDATDWGDGARLGDEEPF